MPTYHFCAKTQIDANTTNYYDGIADAALPIKNGEDYDKLKRDIADKMDGADSGKNVILMSLSLLD